MKRANPDVKRFPRSSLLKFQAEVPLPGIGDNSKCAKLWWRRPVLYSQIQWKTGRRHRSFAPLELSPIPCNGSAAQNFNNQYLGDGLTSGLDIWICPFHTVFMMPRSFDPHDVRIDSKYLNWPHSYLFSFVVIEKMSTWGCAQTNLEIRAGFVEYISFWEFQKFQSPQTSNWKITEYCHSLPVHVWVHFFDLHQFLHFSDKMQNFNWLYWIYFLESQFNLLVFNQVQ